MLIEAAKESPRDRAIIELLAATGLRSGELLNIKLEDIDWESRQIEIKSRARRRVVYVTRSCASVLKEYLATKNGDSPYLFSGKGSGPMSYFCLHRVFRKYSDLLKLGYNITPQTLRYTMAVQVFKKGMPLSIINEMMGYTTNPNNNVLNNALSNICAGYFK